MQYFHTDEAQKLKLRLRSNQGRRKRFRPVRDPQVQAQRRDGHQRLPRGECTYSHVVRSRKEQTIEDIKNTEPLAQWLELTTCILGSQVRIRTYAFFFASPLNHLAGTNFANY